MADAPDTKPPPTLHIDAVRRRVRLSAADPEFVQDPYLAYRLIRDAAPVFFWEDYGFWCFAEHATVNALFRDRRMGREVTHVTTREALGWPDVSDHLKPFYDVEAHSMLEREPPVHTRLRTLVNRAFVSRTVERLRPRAEALAHRLIDGFAERDTVDLLPAFAEPIPVTLIADMMGLSASDAPRLLEWSHRMVAMYQFGRTRAVEDLAVAATQAFAGFIREAIAVRRRSPGDDLLSLLIGAEAGGGRLEEDEIVSTAILLLNAGHEATVHGIGNGVAAVLRSGRDPAALFATPAGVAATVEELLRLDPPLHLFTRYVLEPMQLEGVEFRVGDQVGLLIGAANRDPAVFADPDRLDPGRSAAAHVSFGAGLHFCLGAPLARLELQVALPILFRRLPGLRQAAPARFADRYHFHGLEALHLHPR